MEIEYRIESLANGGDGIGRSPDGHAIFTPFTVPGELVLVRVEADARQILRGEVIKVVEPSPARVIPRCRHYGVCGGCQLQHMDYAAQLDAKTKIVADVFQRVGGLQGVTFLPASPSPSPWNYRNHVQYHLDPTGRLGYQMRASHDIVPIETCHLALPRLEELRSSLNLDPEAGIQRVSLRAGLDNDDMILLETEGDDLPELELELQASVAHSGANGTLILAGNTHQAIRSTAGDFFVSPQSFFQVNLKVAEAMHDSIFAYLPEVIPTAVDLYCGAGFFSRTLAKRSDRLVAIEASPSACDDFAINLDAFDNIELYQGSTDAILPALHLRCDVLLADPPRAGIGVKTLDAIIAAHPSRLVYVSCDPATLARDAARLARNGYNCQSVQPFDMFPQTQHIECVAFFEPAG